MATNLWVGNELDPNDRLHLDVSDADLAKVRGLMRDESVHVTVTDIPSGERYVLRRADCGLGCMCAVALVRKLRPVRNVARVADACGLTRRDFRE